MEKCIKEILPGLAVSIVVGLCSILLSKVIPKVGGATIAIFLGMLVGNLFLNQQVFQKGYKFSESDLLSNDYCYYRSYIYRKEVRLF